jgi:hypothetical protein
MIPGDGIALPGMFRRACSLTLLLIVLLWSHIRTLDGMSASKVDPPESLETDKT